MKIWTNLQISFNIFTLLLNYIDIDECSSNNGGCSQGCSNTIGSYRCYCNSGYSLSNNNATCSGMLFCITRIWFLQMCNFHLPLNKILMSVSTIKEDVSRYAITQSEASFALATQASIWALTGQPVMVRECVHWNLDHGYWVAWSTMQWMYMRHCIINAT